MARFKNISGKKLAIPGIGIVEPEEIKNFPRGFRNANFQRVEPFRPEEKSKAAKPKVKKTKK